MLTSDENILVVDLVVPYRATDPVDYLFDVWDPEETFSVVSVSAFCEVAGGTVLDFILTGGRSSIAIPTLVVILDTLDEYGTGITVTQVALQDAHFPVQVVNAVPDAIKAREDKERYAFEAEAYANDIFPNARGDAAKMFPPPPAYKATVIADSPGEAGRFNKFFLPSPLAPEVTPQPLSIKEIKNVYANSNKKTGVLMAVEI
jgi:Membrane protease subunits, stomatin/prohibitin homologs